MGLAKWEWQATKGELFWISLPRGFACIPPPLLLIVPKQSWAWWFSNSRDLGEAANGTGKGAHQTTSMCAKYSTCIILFNVHKTLACRSLCLYRGGQRTTGQIKIPHKSWSLSSDSHYCLTRYSFPASSFTKPLYKRPLYNHVVDQVSQGSLTSFPI